MSCANRQSWCDAVAEAGGSAPSERPDPCARALHEGRRAAVAASRSSAAAPQAPPSKDVVDRVAHDHLEVVDRREARQGQLGVPVVQVGSERVVAFSGIEKGANLAADIQVWGAQLIVCATIVDGCPGTA